jgi:hypothetical protein
MVKQPSNLKKHEITILDQLSKTQIKKLGAVSVPCTVEINFTEISENTVAKVCVKITGTKGYTFSTSNFDSIMQGDCIRLLNMKIPIEFIPVSTEKVSK